MKVLVDTSVWVAHFKLRNPHLVELLESGLVVCHPYVVVEVACGTPPRRHAIVSMLAQLERTSVATHDEVLQLLERRSLCGRGCGFVDIGLLAAALVSGQTLVWTLDKRLDAIATELGCAYRPAMGIRSN